MRLPNDSPCTNVHGETIGEDELVVNYFKQGYANLEILEFLKLHNTEISLSTLKRRLQAHGSRRRLHGRVVPNRGLYGVIEKELSGSGSYIDHRKIGSA